MSKKLELERWKLVRKLKHKDGSLFWKPDPSIPKDPAKVAEITSAIDLGNGTIKESMFRGKHRVHLNPGSTKTNSMGLKASSIVCVAHRPLKPGEKVSKVTAKGNNGESVEYDLIDASYVHSVTLKTDDELGGIEKPDGYLVKYFLSIKSKFYTFYVEDMDGKETSIHDHDDVVVEFDEKDPKGGNLITYFKITDTCVIAMNVLLGLLYLERSREMLKVASQQPPLDTNPIGMKGGKHIDLRLLISVPLGTTSQLCNDGPHWLSEEITRQLRKYDYDLITVRVKFMSEQRIQQYAALREYLKIGDSSGTLLSFVLDWGSFTQSFTASLIDLKTLKAVFLKSFSKAIGGRAVTNNVIAKMFPDKLDFFKGQKPHQIINQQKFEKMKMKTLTKKCIDEEDLTFMDAGVKENSVIKSFHLDDSKKLKRVVIEENSRFIPAHAPEVEVYVTKNMEQHKGKVSMLSSGLTLNPNGVKGSNGVEMLREKYSKVLISDKEGDFMQISHVSDRRDVVDVDTAMNFIPQKMAEASVFKHPMNLKYFDNLVFVSMYEDSEKKAKFVRAIMPYKPGWTYQFKLYPYISAGREFVLVFSLIKNPDSERSNTKVASEAGGFKKGLLKCDQLFDFQRNPFVEVEYRKKKMPAVERYKFSLDDKKDPAGLRMVPISKIEIKGRSVKKRGSPICIRVKPYNGEEFGMDFSETMNMSKSPGFMQTFPMTTEKFGKLTNNYRFFREPEDDVPKPCGNSKCKYYGLVRYKCSDPKCGEEDFKCSDEKCGKILRVLYEDCPDCGWNENYKCENLLFYNVVVDMTPRKRRKKPKPPTKPKPPRNILKKSKPPRKDLSLDPRKRRKKRRKKRRVLSDDEDDSDVPRGKNSTVTPGKESAPKGEQDSDYVAQRSPDSESDVDIDKEPMSVVVRDGNSLMKLKFLLPKIKANGEVIDEVSDEAGDETSDEANGETSDESDSSGSSPGPKNSSGRVASPTGQVDPHKNPKVRFTGSIGLPPIVQEPPVVGITPPVARITPLVVAPPPVVGIMPRDVESPPPVVGIMPRDVESTPPVARITPLVVAPPPVVRVMPRDVESTPPVVRVTPPIFNTIHLTKRYKTGGLSGDQPPPVEAIPVRSQFRPGPVSGPVPKKKKTLKPLHSKRIGNDIIDMRKLKRKKSGGDKHVEKKKKKKRRKHVKLNFTVIGGGNPGGSEKSKKFEKPKPKRKKKRKRPAGDKSEEPVEAEKPTLTGADKSEEPVEPVEPTLTGADKSVEPVEAEKPTLTGADKKTGKKRKRVEDLLDDEDEVEEPPKKKPRKARNKCTRCGMYKITGTHRGRGMRICPGDSKNLTHDKCG